MPLLEELPPHIADSLKTLRNGQSDTPLSVAIKTDIDKEGRLGERWIVVDNETIRVYSGSNGSNLEKSLNIKDIEGAKTESLVGGGALYVQQGSDVIELVRYSSPLGGRMNSVSRTIEALVNEKELPPDTIDGDDRLCKKCSRPLPKDNDVCSFCLDKRATFARLFSYALPYKAHAVGLVTLMGAGHGGEHDSGDYQQKPNRHGACPDQVNDD
jgi:ATP-binding cassette, subfamily B, bacterial